ANMINSIGKKKIGKFRNNNRPNAGVSFGFFSSRTIIPIIHFPILIPFRLSFERYKNNPGIITENIVTINLLGLSSYAKFEQIAIKSIETIKKVITKLSIKNAAIRLFRLDFIKVICSSIGIFLCISYYTISKSL